MTDPAYQASDYRSHLELVWTFARLIEPLPLAKMIEQAERAEMVGPYLDPTSWMNNRELFLEDLEMMRALRAVQLSLHRMHEKHKPAAACRGAALPASPLPSAPPASIGAGPDRGALAQTGAAPMAENQAEGNVPPESAGNTPSRVPS